jgi:hypothetical protein
MELQWMPASEVSALTCQSTRTHNSRRRLRRECWWSGHFYVRLQMTIPPVVLPSVALLLATALPGCDRRAEVIRLVAVERVSLVAADSSAGTTPRELGSLAPGQAVYVTGCNPRKSDIDVEVGWNGAAAVAVGKYRLERRAANSGDQHTVSSCAGLLGGGA